MHILITRPKSDAAALAQELAGLGHDVTIEPLLQVKFLALPPLDLGNAQALLFTSANGVRAFAQADGRRNITAFAVGQATARAAQNAGFEQVFAAGGDVASLAETVGRTLPPPARLIHIAGSVQAGDLKGDLAARGYDVDRKVLYEATATESLSKETQDKIKGRKIDIILFFSPRTAQIFCKLVDRHRLGDYLDHATAACLSLSVRDILHSLPWRRIVVAKRPTQPDLLVAAGLRTSD